MTTTSSSLIERVKAHDPEAWQRLANIYGPLVYSWCRQFGLRAEDAADIFQEVFRAVHRRIGDFRRERPAGSFRGWLWTITRNKIHDHFRSAGNRPVAPGGSDAQHRLLQLPDADPEIEEASEGGGSVTVLQLAMESVRAQFENRTWQAFWQTVVDEWPTAEVAADLGMTTGAVRKARFRVLRRLRDELGELMDR